MEDLLFKLKRNNIDVEVVDGKLSIHVPEGFDEATIIDEVREKKEALIDYISSRRTAGAILKELPGSASRSSYPLTPPQRRLFLLHELSKESLAYNLPQAYMLEGELNRGRLTEAFKELIRRHESLRTCFEMEGQEPVQKILDEYSFESEFYKGSEADLHSIMNRFVRPFDLARAPLIRAAIVELSPVAHLLMVDMHHIISDGVSQQVLMNDFSRLYNGETLPVLHRQYRDYAEWRQGEQARRAVEGQRNFWKKEFSLLPPALALPTDFARPMEKSYRGQSISFSLDEKDTFLLKEVAQRTGTSLFMVLLSAWSILLSRLSNQEQVVIGTPVAGRNHSDLERIIGMFVNTLALCLTPAGNLSFRNFLSQVSIKALSCFDHQDYPYEDLIDDLKLSRDPGRNPLFDVLFAFQNMNRETAFMDKLNVSLVGQRQVRSKFDMSLITAEDEGCLYFQIEYSTDIFREATIKRFGGYFLNILRAIGDDDTVRLSEISLIAGEEQLYLLNVNNNIDVSYPRHATLVSLFEQQVRATPTKTAVEMGGLSLTYKELNERANRLAHLLRNKGVGRDVIVGILVEKSILTVVGMLAVIKAGGAYLPIDVEYPGERIQYMVEDSGIRILITTSNQPRDITDRLDCIFIDQPLGGERHVDDLPPVNGPEDLCYIIYTSGTTGNPKGVMVEHRNVVRLLFNDAFQFDFNGDDVWTMFHSQCFDVSVWEMYGALLRGGKLVVVSRLDALDPVKYLSILKRQKVTILCQTPTAFYNLVREDLHSEAVLPYLRYVIFAGEALFPLKLRTWREKYPGVKLVNMFGTTETTVHAMYKEIGDYEIVNNISNIGHPIPTLGIYLFDRHMALVPQGVIGELYIGGEGVSRGYLNKPGLTQQRFIAHPLRKGERLYRTGDLARMLPDGEIEYLGRNDHQVQLKGFRIELGEIEYHLVQHDLIDNAIVVVKRNEEPEHKYLCAYLVCKEKVAMEDIRKYLKDKLPAYMIPSYFMPIENIPLTSNNKIDIQLLPEPEVTERAVYIAPRNTVEWDIARVWSKALAVDQPGVKDNFFSLGGDSLKAIGLIYEINQLTGASLTIADLYSNQTIEDLADRIGALNTEEQEDMAAVEKEVADFRNHYISRRRIPDSYEEILPMNGVEKGMVFHSLKRTAGEKDIHKIIYHEQNIYEINYDDFDPNIFRRALLLMTDKHATFRKIYDLDSFAHIVLKEIEPEIQYIDISCMAPGEQKGYMLKKMYEEKIRGTELSFSLLWRMSVIKIADNLHYLVFDMHHSLLDGWSLSSFITELNNTYILLKKDPSFMPLHLRCSYRDQIIGEIAATRNPLSIAFWKSELQEHKRFEFHRTGLAHEYKSDLFDLGEELRSELEDLAQGWNSNFKHICFAAYIYTLYMLSYSDDITAGIVTNNRPLVKDGERLVGCFLNTVPFRARIPAKMTWGGFIRFIEDKLRTLKKHERVPFREILNITGQGGQEGNPIFDTSFNYVDFRVFNEMLSDEGSTVPVERRFQFDNYVNNNTLFDLHIFAHSRGFKIALTYSTSIIDEALSGKIYAYYKRILQQFVRHTGETMRKEAILSPAERRFLLREKGDIVVNYPSTATLVSLFERQAAQKPDSIAVVMDGVSLSYGQLNIRANKIAHRLRSRGAGPNVIVGLLMGRSLDTVTGVLAIIKSGSAYLPIDVDYPEERIHYYLENSEAQLVLTESSQAGVVGHMCDVVFMDAPDGEDWSLSDPDPVNSPDDLCYVIYTSGTTGNPKGVMVSHRNVVRLLFNDAFLFDFTEKDVWTMFHSHCFDFSVWEMYGALLYGGRLVVVSRADAMNPARTLSILREEKVSVLNQTPTAFYNLIQAGEGTDTRLPFLRYVIFGGEALSPAKLKNWKERHPAVRLINMYGITETTVHVTYKEIGAPDIEKNTSNIGRPLPDMSIYLLDKSMQPVPQGITGEIFVGGRGVTSGYLNKRSLTDEKFIVNPYHKEEKLYRSGDLGRMLPTGEIEYLGRADNQVQLRGFRIEPGEIEYHLTQYEQVDDAVVMVQRSYDGGHEDLFAFVTGRGPVPIHDLRAFLKKRLPSHMIPAKFLQIQRIPLTSNGKVDRKALAAMAEEEVQEDTRTQMERVEQQLKTLPGVIEAMVTFIHTRRRSAKDGDVQEVNELVAAVICPEENFRPRYYYQDHLSTTVPEHMIPSRIIQLDMSELSGKNIPGKKLLEEYFERAGYISSPVDGREPNEKEQRIIGIWKSILDTGEVGIHDLFFDVGGHSLHVVQMMTIFRNDLGIDLEFDDIMYMTVEQLAEKYLK